jgi:class 3 adenylate cyclase
MALVRRHYPIPQLDFRDFWDICSHYLHHHPKYRSVLYTINGLGGPLCEDEPDVAIVLKCIAANRGEVSRFIARYYLSPHSEPGDYGNAKLEYLPSQHDFDEPGLYFSAETDNKLQLYQFEEFIYSSYTFAETAVAEIEYGLPCEVLAVVIDIRGFSSFCEQPDIESPYACGLMTAFYSMVRNGFRRYPPDLVKFLGDGVLSVWQTSAKDRRIAIDTAVDGLRRLPGTWRNLVRGPEFTHGAPEGVAAGASFGLASKISIDNDYIGRPINIASRLCSVCPPSKSFISKNVPDMSELEVSASSVHVKSFGDHQVWVLN